MTASVANYSKDFEVYKDIDYGGNGSIHFGLLKETANEIRKRKDPKDITISPEVRKELAAIKMPYSFSASQTAARKEIEVLKLIADRVAKKQPEIQRMFPKYIDSESNEDESQIKFIAMEAIQGITLHRLEVIVYGDSGRPSFSTEMEANFKDPRPAEVKGPPDVIPIPFIFNICLELAEALAFFHDELKWTHGDIKTPNIMLRAPAEGIYGSVVLIDYGSAEPCRREQSEKTKERSEEKPREPKPVKKMIGKLLKLRHRAKASEKDTMEDVTEVVNSEEDHSRRRIQNDERLYFHVILGMLLKHDKCFSFFICTVHPKGECNGNTEECHMRKAGCQYPHPDFLKDFQDMISDGALSGGTTIRDVIERFRVRMNEYCNKGYARDFNTFLSDLILNTHHAGISNAELQHAFEKFHYTSDQAD